MPQVAHLPLSGHRKWNPSQYRASNAHVFPVRTGADVGEADIEVGSRGNYRSSRLRSILTVMSVVTKKLAGTLVRVFSVSSGPLWQSWQAPKLRLLKMGFTCWVASSVWI